MIPPLVRLCLHWVEAQTSSVSPAPPPTGPPPPSPTHWALSLTSWETWAERAQQTPSLNPPPAPMHLTVCPLHSQRRITKSEYPPPLPTMCDVPSSWSNTVTVSGISNKQILAFVILYATRWSLCALKVLFLLSYLVCIH